MLSGAPTGNQPREWMFPWSIPEETGANPAPETPTVASAQDQGEGDQTPKEIPIAYRAWYVQHAEELRES
jgi:hypothetical protein